MKSVKSNLFHISAANGQFEIFKLFFDEADNKDLINSQKCSWTISFRICQL